MPTDIIFVLGPAGVGKSELSSALAQKLGYEFYEIDQHPVSGVDVCGFRPEWDEYLRSGRPDELLALLRSKAHAAGKKGIILSFPSMLILTAVVLRVLEGTVRVVYLTGSEGQCLDAFREREKQSGRGLTALHWAQNKQAIYEFLMTEPDMAGRSG